MNRKLLSTLAGAALLLAACSNDNDQAKEERPAKPQSTEEHLPGTWESVSVRVQVNTADNKDSTYVFEVKEEDWIRRLGTRPIKLYFSPDKKYRQEFIATNDSILNTTRGLWNTFGDTLMLIEPNATYQYTVTLRENGLAEFRTLLDWDGDGEEDDEYLGVHRRISRNTD